MQVRSRIKARTEPPYGTHRLCGTNKPTIEILSNGVFHRPQPCVYFNHQSYYSALPRATPIIFIYVQKTLPGHHPATIPLQGKPDIQFRLFHCSRIALSPIPFTVFLPGLPDGIFGP